MHALGTLEDLPLDYRQALSAQNLVPLWPSLRAVLPPNKPGPRTRATHWPYETLRPLLLQAGELTPTGLWHEHGHDGAEPVVWLDVLDLPLIYYTETSYAIEDRVQEVTATRLERDYARGGVVPSPVLARDTARRCPMLRYPSQANYLWNPASVHSLPVRGSDARLPVKRIFFVGRNYHAHAVEMGLIYTGTPEGVGAVKPGDRITGHVDGVGEIALTIGAAE